jgi:hypothetical protein
MSPEVVRNAGADTVAILPWRETNGIQPRAVAGEPEKIGADLCLAPALLDAAGPQISIRPTPGLTLLHVDHPPLSGPRGSDWQVANELPTGFDLRRFV